MLSGLAAPLLSAVVLGAASRCPACGHSNSTLMWLMIGFLGQAVFTARFLVQWLVSERQRNSVVPVVFWWLSMAGGMILLSYAVSRRDPVIVVGQSMGVFIYVRNLMLVAKGRRRAAKRSRVAEAAVPEATPVELPRPHFEGRSTPVSS